MDEGLINNQQLQELIIDYQSENELNDYRYSDEDQDAIRHMIENFFILAERPLSKYEISFFQLLFNNLYRFIGDDFTLVSPSSCKEYPTNYCVSQKVSGSFSIRLISIFQRIHVLLLHPSMSTKTLQNLMSMCVLL